MTDAGNNRFYHYAVRYLREEFSEKTQSLTDEDIRILIDEGLQASHRYHFSTEQDAMAFIDMDMRLGNVLSEDEPPLWAQKILNDNSLTNEEKMNCLRDAYCTYEWLEQADDRTK